MVYVEHTDILAAHVVSTLVIAAHVLGMELRTSYGYGTSLNSLLVS